MNKNVKRIWLLVAAMIMIASMFTFAAAEEACAHQWTTEVLREAKCVEGVTGITKKVCSLCKETQYERKEGHEWKAGYVPATCEDPEMAGDVCNLCGAAAEGAVEMAPALGHDPVYITTGTDADGKAYFAATCTKEGYGVLSCSRIDECDFEEVEMVIPATGHAWEEVSAENGGFISANCGSPARIKYACKNAGCTETKTEIAIDKTTGKPVEEALEHKNKQTVDVAPTCKEDGYVGAVVCLDCKTVIEEGTVVKSTGTEHVAKLVGSPVKVATCKDNGIGKYECALCKADLSYKVIPADHSWIQKEKKDPTCGVDGKIVYVCALANENGDECAKATKEEAIPATGKHADPVTKTVAATCTEDAKIGEVCPACNKVIGDYESIGYMGKEFQATGHKMTGFKNGTDKEKTYKAATCIEDGYGIVYCTNVNEDGVACKHELAEGVIAKLGHDWKEAEGADAWIPADCGHAGGIKMECSRCDATDIEVAEDENGEPFDPQKKHNEKSIISDDKAVTCKEDGVEGRKICKDCKTVIEEGTVVKSTGTEHVAKLKTTVKFASCEDNGIGKYECELCKADLSYKVILADHSWIQKEKKDATCGVDGKIVYVCALANEKGGECAKATKEETIPATGDHKTIVTKTLAPTCTEDAMVGEVCSACNKVVGEYETIGHLGEEFQATGHKMDGFKNGTDKEKTYKAATCIEDGYGIVYCTNVNKDGVACKHELAEGVIAKLGHNLVEVKGEGSWVAADCGHAGGVKMQCSRCTYFEVKVVEDENGEPLEPQKKHNEKSIISDDKAATCKEDGVEGRKICKDCKTVIEEGTVIKSTGAEHVPSLVGSPVKVPTCVENGIGKYECALCKANLSYKVIPAAHTWADNALLGFEENNCGKDGWVMQECTVDGCDATQKRTVKATGEHPADKRVTTTSDATCTENATVGVFCGVCHELLEEKEDLGEILGGEYLATGHKFAGYVKGEKEGVEYKAPTCTEDGYGISLCVNEGCNAKSEEGVIPALGHEYSKKGELKNANCEHATGYEYRCVRYEKCKAYEFEALLDENGEVLEPKKDHEMNEEELLGHCAGDGFLKNVCAECDYEELLETYPADPDNHITKEYIVKPATCTEKGIKKLECTNEECDYYTFKAIEITHSFEEKDLPSKDSTYIYWQCSKCDETKIVKILEGFDCEKSAGIKHTEENVPEVPATTEKDGAEAGVICSYCGKILSGFDPIPMIKCEHKNVTTAETVVEAKCEEAGSKTVVTTCVDCGTEIGTETTEIPALDHDYAEVKGYAATCKEDGLTDGKQCSVCQAWEVEQTVIEAAGVECTPGEAVTENEVPATCEEAGSHEVVVYCEVCAAEISRDTIVDEALGHENREAVEENRKEATCEEDGSYEVVVYCDVCEKEVSRTTEIISAEGHVAGEATEENRIEASCEEDGSYDVVVKCEVCGKELSKDTQIIPAEGHKEETVAGKAATCTEAGLTDGVVCTVCDTVIEEQKATEKAGHKYSVSYDLNDDGTVQIATYTCKTCGDTYTESKEI